MPDNIKGVILAAGLGTRLRPITSVWPKPLVPVLGTTPLELALYRLHRAGIQDVAINCHHLPELIAKVAKKNPFNQNIHISFESTLLGTGGVYAALKNWRKQSNLLVLNGDIVSNINLNRVIEFHSKLNPLATMVLLPKVISGETAVWYKANKIYTISKDTQPGLTPGNFACAQILSAEFLETLPKNGVFDIISRGYNPALEKNLEISCLLHEGIWHDIGNPYSYWAALRNCLVNLKSSSFLDLGIAELRKINNLPTNINQHYILDDSLSLCANHSNIIGELTIIETGSRIGRNCKMREVVILPGTEVPDESTLYRTIVGPSFIMPID